MLSQHYELRLNDANAALTGLRFDEAEQKFMALSRDFSDLLAFDGLARVAEARSDWQLALDRWDDCLAQFTPDPPHSWLLSRAWALFHLERYIDAEAAFASICKSFPHLQDPFAGVAFSVFHQGKWEDAFRVWDLLFERFPETRGPQFLLPYAKSLESAGHATEALTALSEILLAYPENLEALRFKSNVLLRHGRPHEAAAVNAEALRMVPNDVELLLQAVLISIRLQNMEGAREALQSAVTVAESIQELTAIFRQTPAIVEGWERTSLWIKLEQHVNSLMSEGTLEADAASNALALRLRLALRDYNGFLARLDKTFTGDDNVIMTRLRETGKRLRAERFPDFDATKIFGIGLTKT